MAAANQLVWETPLGVPIADIDYLSISCTIRVNSPGILEAQVDGAHWAIAQLSNLAKVRLLRSDLANGIPQYSHFNGIWEYQKRNNAPATIFDMISLGCLDMLSWRHILWYAETANRSKFSGVAAETVMKTLVNYNAGAAATTANGRRLKNGTITGLTVEGDSARGGNISVACAWDNLLTTLQKIPSSTIGDFDLIRTGANAYDFRYGCWHETSAGNYAVAADRRSTLVFSKADGNIEEEEYTYDARGEATSIVVGGRGDLTDRDLVLVSGPNYSATNDRETFLNATQVAKGDTNSLTQVGNTQAYNMRAKETMGVHIVQTENCRFAKHYWLGDLATLINPYTGISTPIKIWAVTITQAGDAAEDIVVEIGTY